MATDTQRSTQASEASAAKPRKRAVVVIHGIGNQAPMTTIREFVESVWSGCKDFVVPPPPRTWTKRDLEQNNFELRRVTTNADTSGRRTDFFEFYWADQMEDTQLADVLSWLQRLFVRAPHRLPPAIQGAWLAGIAGMLVFVAGVLASAWLTLGMLRAVPSSTFGVFWRLGALGFLAGLFWLLRHVVLVQVVGDAARYLTASPPNIAARSRVRTLGMQLLTALHESDDYDRIIFACHSLGTVIGYDILNFYWSTINEYVNHAPGDEALREIEQCIHALHESPEDPMALARFRDAQRRYAEIVRELSNDRWKVTDLVTLGSPLTYAYLLMVDDSDQLLGSDLDAIRTGELADRLARLDPVTRDVAKLFFARMGQREFPICPPLPERGDAFTYSAVLDGTAVPHHAAVFAPVRWTNIFAPCHFVLKGDIVGGPVAPIFGPGVKDVALTGDVGTSWLAHTHYWDQGRKDEHHLAVLRDALNFLDVEEATEAMKAQAEKRAERVAVTEVEGV